MRRRHPRKDVEPSWLRRARRLAVPAAMAAALAAGRAAAEPTISIVRPPAGIPLFDQVDVVLEVDSGARVARVGARVELFLDGRSAGILDRPPYEIRIDVGADNRDRRLEAVLRDPDGEVVARAVAHYPALVVHDQVELALRQLYVMVSDRRGRRVLDLERGDFTVRDQGQPQRLITFERGDIPFAAVLLLDGSRSMRGARLQLALAGARSFIGGMRQHDQARLVVYSDHLLEATPWHGPDSTAAAAVAVEADGGTSVHDHLYLGLRMVDQRQGRRVVILLSDGWDQHSVLDVDQLEDTARRSEAILYWVRRSGEAPKIGLQAAGEAPRLVPLSSWRDRPELLRAWRRLERLVRQSGGRVVRIAGVHEVKDSFHEILQELRQQYALGYYPSSQNRDGSWRQVAVTIGRAGVRVRTREGYVDE